MATVQVVANKRQIAELDRVGKDIKNFTPRVLQRSVNKVTRGQRTVLVRLLSKKLKLKQAEVKEKNIKMKLASFKDLAALIRIVGKAIPLIRFGARQTKKGVTYKEPGTNGRKLIPHAFIQMVGTKRRHRGVFIRVNKSLARKALRKLFRRSSGSDSGLVGRLPIKELYGPNPIDVINPTLPQFEKETADKLQKEIATQMKVVLEQANAGTNY